MRTLKHNMKLKEGLNDLDTEMTMEWQSLDVI